MASRVMLLAATLRATAHGQAVNPRQVDCRNALVRAAGQSPFALAALCRSALPSDVCREASHELGQQPWTSDRVGSVCEKWESRWAIAAASKARDLDAVGPPPTNARDSVDRALGNKQQPPNPWKPPLPGINPFYSPVYMIPGAANATAPEPPNATALGLPAEAVFGILELSVSDIVLLVTDLTFGSVVRSEVARVAKVEQSNLTVTLVRITPEEKGGVIQSSGEIQVFFFVTAADGSEAKAVKNKLQGKPIEAFSFELWNAMTAKGSNQHTFLVRGISAQATAEAASPAGAEEASSDDKEGAKAAAPSGTNETSSDDKEGTKAAAPSGTKETSSDDDKGAKETSSDDGKGAKEPEDEKERTRKALATVSKGFSDLLGEKTAVPVLSDGQSKGLSDLLGKETPVPVLADEGKAVLVKAEVHERGPVMQDNVPASTWASTILTCGFLAGISLAVTAALTAVVHRRRHAARRLLLPRGDEPWQSAAALEVPSLSCHGAPEDVCVE